MSPACTNVYSIWTDTLHSIQMVYTILFISFFITTSLCVEQDNGSRNVHVNSREAIQRNSQVSRYGSTWSAWSYSPCKHGRQVRARACRTWGGYSCQGPSRQTLTCASRIESKPQNYPATPRERARYFVSPTFGAVWSPWSAWTECYKSRQDRVRACHRRVGYRCSGSDHQARQCNEGEESDDDIEWRKSQRFYGFDKDRLIRPITTAAPKIFDPQDYLRMNPHDLDKDWAMAQLGIGRKRWFAPSTTPINAPTTTPTSISTVELSNLSATNYGNLSSKLVTELNLERKEKKPLIDGLPVWSGVDHTTTEAPRSITIVPSFDPGVLKMFLSRKKERQQVVVAPKNPFEDNSLEELGLSMPPPPPQYPQPELSTSERKHKAVEGLDDDKSKGEQSVWNFGSLASPKHLLAEKFGLSTPIPTVPADSQREDKGSATEKLQNTFQDVLIKYYEELLRKHGLKLKETDESSNDNTLEGLSKIKDHVQSEEKSYTHKKNDQSNVVLLPSITTSSLPEYDIIPHPEPNYHHSSEEQENKKLVPIPEPSALVSSPRRLPLKFSHYTPIYIPTATTPIPVEGLNNDYNEQAEPEPGSEHILKRMEEVHSDSREELVEAENHLRPLRVRDNVDTAIPEHRSRRIEPWAAPLVFGPNLKTSSEFRSANENTPTYWLYTVFKDHRKKSSRRSSRFTEKEKAKRRQSGRADSVSIPHHITFLPGFGQSSSAQWSLWSVWSSCDKGKRSRTRQCDYENTFLTIGCAGPSYQVENCGWSSLLDLLPDPNSFKVPWEDEIVQEQTSTKSPNHKLIVFERGNSVEQSTQNKVRRSRRKFAALQRRRLRLRI